MHRIATAHLRRFHIPPPPAQKIVAMPKIPVDLTGAEA
jgi:hypothetical protein